MMVLQEGAPLTLAGHRQDLEHLATDGHLVLSHCLAGRCELWLSLHHHLVQVDSVGLSHRTTPHHLRPWHLAFPTFSQATLALGAPHPSQTQAVGHLPTLFLHLHAIPYCCDP